MYQDTTEQLELGFDCGTMATPPRPRHRLPQASWWFEQIRQMLATNNGPVMPRAVQGRFQFPPRRKLGCAA